MLDPNAIDGRDLVIGNYLYDACRSAEHALGLLREAIRAHAQRDAIEVETQLRRAVEVTENALNYARWARERNTR
jgi:hypothetical protein